MTDVTASAVAHEYYLKVVPTVVDEVNGKDLLYACQYTYAKKVSDYIPLLAEFAVFVNFFRASYLFMLIGCINPLEVKIISIYIYI